MFRNKIKVIFFLTIPWIVLFIFLEVGVRIWLGFFSTSQDLNFYGDAQKLSEERLYQPHHYYIYDLTPDFGNKLGTFHNTFGFRSKEIQKQKPDDVYRIFFIGGSTTYTVAVKENTKIFTYLLEDDLNKRLHFSKNSKYKKIEVVNAGVGGYTSAENLIRIIFKISEFAPDLVVIQHGLNDILPRLNGDITSDYSNFRKSWYQPKKVNKNLLNTFKRGFKKSKFFTFVFLRLGLIKLPVIGDFTIKEWSPQDDKLNYNGTKYFQRNTEYMVKFLKMIGSEIILVSEPYNDNAISGRVKGMPEHNALLEEIAGKLQCSFFDLYKNFPKNEPYLLSDGVHVSEKGSYKKYELLRDYLINGFQLFSKLRGDGF